MSMTILPETSRFAATISYGMPTTGSASEAQRKFSCRQIARELIDDESDSDSAVGTTTANSNTYSYVDGNPVSRIDPLGLAEICERPLHLQLGPLDFGPAFYLMGRSSTDDRLNTELKHEHIFFDNGSDIGFGPDGVFRGENKAEYSSCKKIDASDESVQKAVRAVGNPGAYKRLTNNCQGYVKSVLEKVRSGR